MRPAPLLALALLPLPALAGVDEAVDGVVLPAVAAFAEATAALGEASAGTCDPAALGAPYQAAWDAWARLGDARLGPTEAAALSVAFWPDERGAAGRALQALVAAEDEGALVPEAVAEGSVAARGLTALDLLLHGDLAASLAPGSHACRLVAAVAADLAAQGAAIEAGWPAEAEALRTAGEPGNGRYLSGDEAFRALYTQVVGGLELAADSRLGRPLGEFDRPRPTRAEAWRSGRPLPNVLLAARAAADLARALADGPTPATDAALLAVEAAGARVADPTLAGVADPQGRLLVEILQQRIRALSDAIEAEVGTPRGIAAGFNSQDGD